MNYMEIKRLIVGALSTNCYLLVSESEVAIVDPGDEAGKILAEVKKTGAELKYIINTHYHFDHTLANKELKQKTGAEILIHEAEKDFINFEADRFLKEGEEIKIGNDILKVIHTPGHTAGSISLLGQDFVLVGDLLFKDGHGRTDLPGGSEVEIENSLKKLAKLVEPETTIYPGHGGIFEYREAKF